MWEHLRLTIIIVESVMKMSNSGRLINYTLRPAKCVERKIMCELLTKFRTEVPIHLYRYIGFGAFYFSDFVLFHNQLNINQMISIEQSSNAERYNFNKPYKCIEMAYGPASHVIANKIKFSGEIKDIVWLDYDGNFATEVLNDMLLLLDRVSSGSFVFTSFNTSIPDDECARKMPYLQDNFPDYLPPKLEEKDISKKTIPSILFSVVDTAVQKGMVARNVKEEIDLVAKPVFFVKYNDNAEMLTIGYYIVRTDNFDESILVDMPWCPQEEKPFSIDVPCFTKAEIREINRFLPGSTAAEIHAQLPYLEEKDIKKYIGMYKYYPNFLDSQYYV